MTDHGRRALVRDVSWAGLSHVGVSLLQLAVQVVAARSLGAALYGVYGAATAVASTLEVVFVTRSSELALQLIGPAWVRAERGFGYAIAQRVVQRDVLYYAAVFGVTALASPWLGRALQVPAALLVLMVASVPTQVGYGVAKGMFIMTGRVREQARLEMAFAVLQATGCLVGLATAGITGLVAGQVLASLGKSIIAWRMVRPWWEGGRPTEEDVQRAASENWREAELHSMLRNVLQYGASQLDVLVLAGTGTPAAVGVYKVARTLAGLPVRAAGPIWAAIRPRLLHAWHRGDRRAVRRWVVFPAAMLLAGGMLALPLIHRFGPAAVTRMYGAAFADAVPVLEVLVLGTWLFGGATAWFPFWVILAARRLTGSLTFGLLFLLTLGGAILFGHRSATAMAWAVALASLVTAVVAWTAFLAGLASLTPSEGQGPTGPGAAMASD